MSLIKNLKRREVEIFGAKRVVRNDFKKNNYKEEISKENKKQTEKTTTKKKSIKVGGKK